MQLPCGTPSSPIKLKTPQKQLPKVYTVYCGTGAQTILSLGDTIESVLRSRSVLLGASLVKCAPCAASESSVQVCCKPLPTQAYN